MTPEPIKTYVRIQQIGSAVGNILCNVLLGWVLNRSMAPMTLFGDRSIIIDTAVTSIIASLLVTLFAASGINRDLKSHRLVIPPRLPPGRGALSRLPRSAWGLGLILGVTIAVVLTALTLAAFSLTGAREIPARWFLIIKGIYTGLLGMFVARWAILRQLTPEARCDSTQP